jgi:DNA-binding SARP family transcriptional activator
VHTARADTTFAARAAGRGEDLTPLVVVAAGALSPATADALCALTEPGGQGVGLLTVEAADAAWQLAVNEADGALIVPALDQLHVVVPQASRRAEEALSTIVADPPYQPAPLPEDEDKEEPSTDDRGRVVEEDHKAECPVLVRVLGPVDIVGSAAPLAGKGLELVTYLALHPDGARREQIETALWPNLRVNPTSFRNRLSAARNALGTAPDGQLLLPHRDSDHTRLHAGVRTDLDQLQDHVDRSRHQDPPTAINTLVEGLELVRGAPFETSNGYEWAIAELHVAHATCLAGDAGLRLADLALTAGDIEQALWATDRALRAAPCNERLYQARMRAFAARGDPDGVEASMQTLITHLETEDPRGDLHPDTWATYEELGQGRRREPAHAG